MDIELYQCLFNETPLASAMSEHYSHRDQECPPPCKTRLIYPREALDLVLLEMSLTFGSGCTSVYETTVESQARAIGFIDCIDTKKSLPNLQPDSAYELRKELAVDNCPKPYLVIQSTNQQNTKLL